MKPLIFLIFLSLAFCAGLLVAHYQLFPYPQIKAVKQHFFPRQQVRLQNNDYFSRKVSQHQLLKGQAFNLLFVGDSLIDEADWAQFFPNDKVANLGINADTTDGVLNRIDTINSVDSEKLFLMIGVNDIFIGKELSVIQNNYQHIVELLSKRKGELYLLSCLFVGSSYSQYGNKITALNHFIEQLSEESEKIIYINLNPALARDRRLSPEYTNDDVHLNGNGYQRWVEVLAQYVSE